MANSESHPEKSVYDLFNLQGKVAVLTGAAGWLGAAMSRALAEAGATLAVTSRDAGRADQFAASLPGSDHIGLGFDQGDTDSIPGLVQTVIDRLGQIDILVNNAYGGTGPSIDNATAEDFDRAYHTGVTAYFLLAREVANHLRGRGAPGRNGRAGEGACRLLGRCGIGSGPGLPGKGGYPAPITPGPARAGTAPMVEPARGGAVAGCFRGRQRCAARAGRGSAGQGRTALRALTGLRSRGETESRQRLPEEPTESP